MARLEHLCINHFRGIEKFEQWFGNGITCIIGRGDSGKSTILDAIAYLFSQSWTIRLNDSDFKRLKGLPCREYNENYCEGIGDSYESEMQF